VRRKNRQEKPKKKKSFSKKNCNYFILD